MILLPPADIRIPVDKKPQVSMRERLSEAKERTYRSLDLEHARAREALPVEAYQVEVRGVRRAEEGDEVDRVRRDVHGLHAVDFEGDDGRGEEVLERRVAVREPACADGAAFERASEGEAKTIAEGDVRVWPSLSWLVQVYRSWLKS